jgi:hypothetical protein
MTIDQIMEKSADELEKMTDAELMTYFAPYLKAVRPDPNKPVKKQSGVLSKDNLRSFKPRDGKTDAMRRAEELMKRFNIQ